MADPLSIAGSAVGIVSLGLQVGHGLFDYYKAWKGQAQDVAQTLKKVSRLLELLGILHDKLNEKPRKDHGKVVESAMADCMEDCKGLIHELKEQLDKFKSHDDQKVDFRAIGRRLAYPFRQSTLQKLEEDIDAVMTCLSFALQLLQQQIVEAVYTEAEAAKALVELVRASQVSDQIRDWLKAPDATINFNEALRKKHPSTGKWFVDGDAYANWLEKPSFLWLVGFAGCGKSVLVSTAIQHAFKHRNGNSRIGVAFFFLTFNDKGKQDSSAMLRALILQLSCQQDISHKCLQTLHKNYRDASPSDDDLMECLLEMIRTFDEVYIIIDALDEGPRDTHRPRLLQYIADLRAFTDPTVTLHLMVSSRDEVDIRGELEATREETIRMRNEGIDADISMFIAQQLSNNRQLRKWAEHHNRIEAVLTEKAEGVFRWVECQFKALLSCPPSEYHLEVLLDSLPRSLDETYERMLSHIPPEAKDDARRMLMMLCCSTRPLAVSELIEGMAVELSNDAPKLNPKRRLKNIDALQEVCPGFTEVDTPEYGEAAVRIAHFSVKEYLESDRIYESPTTAMFGTRNQSVQTDMALICTAILLTIGLRREAIAAPPSLPEVTDDAFSFAFYFADSWDSHYFKSIKEAHSATVEDQVLRLFSVDTIMNWIHMRLREGGEWNYSEEFGDPGTPLYYASLLGVDIAVRRLAENITSREEIDAAGGRYGNALQTASQCGHEGAARVLLDLGADANVEGGWYGSALAAAAYSGAQGIVRLLLDAGADPNAGGTAALHIAAASGHKAITKLLLDAGANINAADESYGTALLAALRIGDEQVVSLLIEKGADVNLTPPDVPFPLEIAAQFKQVVLAKLLLDNGAAVCEQGKRGEQDEQRQHVLRLALREAVVHGREDVARLLLSRGAQAKDTTYFGSAMWLAVCHHLDNMVQLLEEHGGVVNPANSGETCEIVEEAARGNDAAVRDLLLKEGADINSRDHHGRSVLQAACEGGHRDVVELLLKNGVEVPKLFVDEYASPYWLAQRAPYRVHPRGQSITTMLSIL